MLRCQRRDGHPGPGAARLGPAPRDPRHAERYEIVINGAAANASRNCIFTRIGTIGGPRRSAQFAAANRPASKAGDGPISGNQTPLGKQGGIAS
jgi:hypothetical protein